MKAPDLLKKAADIMEERGKQYDKPEGERSMGAAVSAFTCITGVKLTEAEGWLLLQILKDVRQWQNPSRYHQDSAEDCIAYAALKAEALSGMDAVQPIINNPSRLREYERDNFGRQNMLEWPSEDSPKQQLVGQSGEMADEVYAAVYGEKPSWDDAPKDAKSLGCLKTIGWFWYVRPESGWSRKEIIRGNYKIIHGYSEARP